MTSSPSAKEAPATNSTRRALNDRHIPSSTGSWARASSRKYSSFEPLPRLIVCQLSTTTHTAKGGMANVQMLPNLKSRKLHAAQNHFVPRYGDVVILPNNVLVPFARMAARANTKRIKRFHTVNVYWPGYVSLLTPMRSVSVAF
jgi:hypothetical protein